MSTLPHLQHGAVTNNTMAGDTEVGREGGGGMDGGRESPRDTERVQVRMLVTHAQLILHSKICRQFWHNSYYKVHTYMYMHT